MGVTDFERSLRAKRDAAMARPELRGGKVYIPVSEKLPEENRECLIWAKMPQDTYPYRVRFPVVYRGGHWFNAASGTQIQVEVVGWNYRANI